MDDLLRNTPIASSIGWHRLDFYSGRGLPAGLSEIAG